MVSTILQHPLFQEIELFSSWAKNLSNIPEEERSGEWECDYKDWSNIYKYFEDFLSTYDSADWTDEIKNRIIYIIARDNESEILSEILSKFESALISLAQFSISSELPEAKWQLAINLSNLQNKNIANELLEAFVNDPNEYVNRRALVELAKNKSDKTEYYCEKTWNRNVYGKMDEYQKISVLYALNEIQSSLLEKYLTLAKKDGRDYLLQNANQIESHLK